MANPADEVAVGLGSDPVAGLSEAQAADRLAVAGANEVATRGRRSVWRLVLTQLTDTMIVVLLASALLTAAIGDLTDTTVILAPQPGTDVGARPHQSGQSAVNRHPAHDHEGGARPALRAGHLGDAEVDVRGEPAVEAHLPLAAA